jgi:hypothetical protein
MKLELIYFSFSNSVWILCYRNDLYEEEYVTIDSIAGEMRTGKDPVDFEEIEVLYYTVVATDGELETLKNVSRFSRSLECDWILLRYKKQVIIS